MTDRPKRTASEPTLVLDRAMLPPIGPADDDVPAFLRPHDAGPVTLPAPSSEVPPSMTILDVPPEERAAMLREMREAETRVECKICSTCPGCHGTHMVTPERARQIENGEVDDALAVLKRR